MNQRQTGNGSAEIVTFSKSNGPLSKKISLDDSGKLISDGSACVMARGTARRVAIADIGELATLISSCQSHEALALGRLRGDLPDNVDVITKRKLNGADAGIIARTADHIRYQRGTHGFVLGDYDTKGMPEDLARRIAGLGGFVAALTSVLPALATTARLLRASTSAGLYRFDTRTWLPGSNGAHLYLAVQDVADSERFLRTLHNRCWLAGFGWYMISASGQLLERSIIDRMVGQPERLVFEGPPELIPPLAQDDAARQPVINDGAWLDTLAQCPPLRADEQAWLEEIRTKTAYHIEGDRVRIRDEFIRKQAKTLAQQSGISESAARTIIERQCRGTLLPSITLPFDDDDLVGKTVADVLADPESFLGETLADPLEGIGYGRGVAKIMRRDDGSIFIHSFAHGRAIYELKLDAAAVRAACERAAEDEIITTLIRLILSAEINAIEIAILIDWAQKKTGFGKREINRLLKEARSAKVAEEKQRERKRLAAERTDPRPQMPVPKLDVAYLPEMEKYSEVIVHSPEPIPPARNVEGDLNRARKRPLMSIHAYSKSEDVTLPAPDQWVIVKLSIEDTEEMLERHIDFIDDDGRSVQCPRKFACHFMKRDDAALPYLVAIASLPIVLADGNLLLGDTPHRMHGLNRQRGIAFTIAPEIMHLIPAREACTTLAIGQALAFLIDEWLVDVATDLTGKLTLVAMGLTIIERSLLDQRPAFWITAGAARNGKTTTLQMIIEAVTGTPAVAAAWSPNEEERRKALLSYFDYGMAYILWDNIPRGSQVACPHIERSCTSAFYTDRKLGVSEVVATAAATIHMFTGNNIAPKSDLASRSLMVRLEVNQTDPENRKFKHSDPLGWTQQNRAKILQSPFRNLIRDYRAFAT
jgi:hypothetical protein